jgi:cyclophilin family peptidyl-prolyl cis-trans isomerase
MASAGKDLNSSQFYITMRGDDMEVGQACPLTHSLTHSPAY